MDNKFIVHHAHHYGRISPWIIVYKLPNFSEFVDWEFRVVGFQINLVISCFFSVLVLVIFQFLASRLKRKPLEERP